MKSTRRVLGHLLLRSLAPLSLLHAPHCSVHSHARSFVFSLAHSLTEELMGKRFNLGDNKTGAVSSCPLKLQKMVIDLANLNIF